MIWCQGSNTLLCIMYIVTVKLSIFQWMQLKLTISICKHSTKYTPILIENRYLYFTIETHQGFNYLIYTKDIRLVQNIVLH